MTTKSTTDLGGIEVSDAEIKKAKKEGVLDRVREGADLSDPPDYEGLSEEQSKRVRADLNSTPLAPLLDLAVDELKRRLTKDKEPDFIDFEHAKGLLALERSGRNRTGYVRMLMDVIGVDSPYDVTSAGPPYTNDETAVTDL